MPFVCNETCQLITRIVFLVFIVALSGYFFWINEKVSDGKPLTPTEAFVEERGSQEKLVAQIYIDLYKRPPNTKELHFWMEYLSDKPNMTSMQLTDIIESISPNLVDTLSKRDAQLIAAKEVDLVIFEAFNEILMRNPSPTEFQKYQKLMVDDATFTRDKLVHALMSLGEYIRMEKTQTNTIHSNLPGNLTDRQITMIIVKIHQEVTGLMYVDEDNMNFFKKKFLELDMNESWFRDFLQNILMWNPNSSTSTLLTTTIDASTVAPGGPTVAPGGPTVAPTGPTVAPGGPTVAPAGHTVAPGGPTVAPGGPTVAPGGPTGGVVGSAVTIGSAESRGQIYNNPTIYNMCVPNADIVKQIGNGDNVGDMVNSISKMESIRDIGNVDEDYASIFYTKRFTEKDMVLDPSQVWSVPQPRPPVCAPTANCQVNALNDQTALIGTLLAQAKSTRVGSILPVFPPT
jgi:hypothetical protein